MRGQLTTVDEVSRFILAEKNKKAKVAFTLVSKVTGTSFTYEISQKVNERVFYVKVLTGANNDADYERLAVITDKPGARLAYFHMPSSRIKPDAPSAVALQWFALAILRDKRATSLAQLEVFHEGKCGKCGHRLTVKTSILAGFGPDCAAEQ